MNTENRPKIDRVRSIFDSDDSEDDSSSITENISQILKATSPSNLNIDSSADNILQNANTSDNKKYENIQNNINKNLSKENQSEFDSLLLNENYKDDSNSSSSCNSSDFVINNEQIISENTYGKKTEKLKNPNQYGDNEPEIKNLCSDSDRDYSSDNSDQEMRKPDLRNDDNNDKLSSEQHYDSVPVTTSEYKKEYSDSDTDSKKSSEFKNKYSDSDNDSNKSLEFRKQYSDSDDYSKKTSEFKKQYSDSDMDSKKSPEFKKQYSGSDNDSKKISEFKREYSDSDDSTKPSKLIKQYSVDDTDLKESHKFKKKYSYSGNDSVKSSEFKKQYSDSDNDSVKSSEFKKQYSDSDNDSKKSSEFKNQYSDSDNDSVKSSEFKNKYSDSDNNSKNPLEFKKQYSDSDNDSKKSVEFRKQYSDSDDDSKKTSEFNKQYSDSDNDSEIATEFIKQYSDSDEDSKKNLDSDNVSEIATEFRKQYSNNDKKEISHEDKELFFNDEKEISHKDKEIFFNDQKEISPKLNNQAFNSDQENSCDYNKPEIEIVSELKVESTGSNEESSNDNDFEIESQINNFSATEHSSYGNNLKIATEITSELSSKNYKVEETVNKFPSSICTIDVPNIIGDKVCVEEKILDSANECLSNVNIGSEIRGKFLSYDLSDKKDNINSFIKLQGQTEQFEKPNTPCVDLLINSKTNVKDDTEILNKSLTFEPLSKNIKMLSEQLHIKMDDDKLQISDDNISKEKHDNENSVLSVNDVEVEAEKSNHENVKEVNNSETTTYERKEIIGNNDRADICIDEEISSLKLESSNFKETFTDMHVDTNSITKESSGYKHLLTESITEGLTSGTVACYSDNENALIIDECSSAKSKDHLGFENDDNSVKKFKDGPIFTDSDSSDVDCKQTAKKVIMSKSTESKGIQPDIYSNATNGKKKPVKGLEQQFNKDLTEFMIALERGWKREVVYRGTSGSNRLDVYYYTPSGQKLRSKVEIETYLQQNQVDDLSTNNFSFRKKPFGAGEQYERIRHAVARPVNEASQQCVSPSHISSVQQKIQIKPLLIQKRRIAPKTVSQAHSNIFKPVNEKNVPFNTYIPQNTMTYTTSPLTSSDVAAVQKPSVLTPLINGDDKEKTFHCTSHCKKAIGRVPNLQCVICLCLFHHECCFMPENTVSLIIASHAKFLCPNCYKTKSEHEYKMSFELPSHQDPLSFLLSDEDDEGFGSDIADYMPHNKIKLRPRTPTNIMRAERFPPEISCIPATNSVQEWNMQPNGGIVFNSQPSVYSNLLQSPRIPIQNLPIQNKIHELIKENLPPINIEGFIKREHSISKQKMFEDFSNGYAILKRIFSYLDIPDLLVVAQVCTMWKDLAYNPIFWKNVRLRNVCIKDWPKMVNFLKQRRTTHIDMRKMVFNVPPAISPPQSEEPMDVEENTILQESYKEMTLPCAQNEMEEVQDEIYKKGNFNPIIDSTEEIDNLPEANQINPTEELDATLKDTTELQNEQPDLANSSTDSANTSILSVTTSIHSAAASTSGIVSQERMKRKLVDTENSGIVSKRQKIDESELDNSAAGASFLSEHDYYLDMNSYQVMSGQCVGMREEIVASVNTSEESMEISKKDDIESNVNFRKDKQDIHLFEENLINPKISPNKNVISLLPKMKDVCDKETQFVSHPFQQEKPASDGDYKVWHEIYDEISKLDCLKRITLGNTDSNQLEILLYYCRQIQSLSVSNIFTKNSRQTCFDPSYLMPVKNLKELKFVCSKPFSFKSNFNFIKLLDLKVLMLKGLKPQISGWPYMGTSLTHLYLSPIYNFSKNNWENLANMSDLVHLELESCFDDTNLCNVLPRMKNLKRICLYDWHVGPKLSLSLRRMTNVDSFFIIPAEENEGDEGLYSGRVLALVQAMKSLREFHWGIQPSVFIKSQKGHIYLRYLKENETSKPISLENLEVYLKQRKPNVHIVIKKVSNSVLNFRCFSN